MQEPDPVTAQSRADRLNLTIGGNLSNNDIWICSKGMETMKTTLTATLIAALASPVMAGGPVIIEEEIEIVAERPASSVGVLPILIAIAIGVAVFSSGDDDDNNESTD
jgi:hypothetical protein